MIVLIDGATHGAQTVVTVGQHVGHGKFLETAGACRLDNAHIGDVMRCQCVKTNAKSVRSLLSRVVICQNACRKGVSAGGLQVRSFGVRLLCRYDAHVLADDNGIIYQFNHGSSLLLCGGREATRVSGHAPWPVSNQKR